MEGFDWFPFPLIVKSSSKVYWSSWLYQLQLENTSVTVAQWHWSTEQKVLGSNPGWATIFFCFQFTSWIMFFFFQLISWGKLKAERNLSNLVRVRHNYSCAVDCHAHPSCHVRPSLRWESIVATIKFILLNAFAWPLQRCWHKGTSIWLNWNRWKNQLRCSFEGPRVRMETRPTTYFKCLKSPDKTPCKIGILPFCASKIILKEIPPCVLGITQREERTKRSL